MYEYVCHFLDLGVFQHVPRWLVPQLRIRVSEVEDVAEDFQQFQFPELDGAWKGSLWSYNPKVLVSTFFLVKLVFGELRFIGVDVFCGWGEEHLKKNRQSFVGIGVCIQNVTTQNRGALDEQRMISFARSTEIQLIKVRCLKLRLTRKCSLEMAWWGWPPACTWSDAINCSWNLWWFPIEVLQIDVAGCGITRGKTWKRYCSEENPKSNLTHFCCHRVDFDGSQGSIHAGESVRKW